jgi:hypothetical protein
MGRTKECDKPERRKGGVNMTYCLIVIATLTLLGSFSSVDAKGNKKKKEKGVAEEAVVVEATHTVEQLLEDGSLGPDLPPYNEARIW